jgi:hypothetical protein
MKRYIEKFMYWFVGILDVTVDEKTSIKEVRKLF